MNDSILVFACDHRKNVKWDLPYIRLGNYQSDAACNIKNDEEIAPYQLLLSEGAQMWWVSKHYHELGNPDYVGFCHYRRFFSFKSSNFISNIPQSRYYPDLCAKPIDILALMKQKNLDGITFIPLRVTNDAEYKFIDIKDQLKFLATGDKLGLTNDIIDQCFDMLFQNCKDSSLNEQLHKAMTNRLTYVCNIFVLRKNMFIEFSKHVFPVFKELMSRLSEEQLKTMHPRFMGYILERFTSMFLYAFQNLGNKIGIMPLITIDAHIHEKWNSPATIG